MFSEAELGFPFAGMNSMLWFPLLSENTRQAICQMIEERVSGNWNRFKKKCSVSGTYRNRYGEIKGIVIVSRWI